MQGFILEETTRCFPCKECRKNYGISQLSPCLDPEQHAQSNDYCGCPVLVAYLGVLELTVSPSDLRLAGSCNTTAKPVALLPDAAAGTLLACPQDPAHRTLESKF